MIYNSIIILTSFLPLPYSANTIVLSGPTGCGMTASVYACAAQLDFKVLELNPTMYRTGKNIFDQVSEAVVSHQVSKTVELNDSKCSVKDVPTPPAPKTERRDFFSARKSGSVPKKTSKVEPKKKTVEQVEDEPTKGEIAPTQSKSTTSATATSVDAMSLILFEQVDISYEELDRGFFQGMNFYSSVSNSCRRYITKFDFSRPIPAEYDPPPF